MTAERSGETHARIPRVVVVVGTDHHPFNRLIAWVNGWLTQHPDQAAGFFVQAGTASVTPACHWSPSLDIDQLDNLLNEADVMVSHGGPASIANAWSRKQLPIVVPRLRRLGEHIDDHQLDFSRKAAEVGRVRLAETAADFTALLDEAAHDIAGFRAGGLESAVDEVVARFAMLVDELVSRPRRLLSARPVSRPGRGLITATPSGGRAAAKLPPEPNPAVRIAPDVSRSPSWADGTGGGNEERE